MAMAQRFLAWQTMAGELLRMGFEPAQLRDIRVWFESIEETEMAWLQFGEALHQISHGEPLGFQLWAAWSKATAPDWFNMGHHLIIWRNFDSDARPD